MWEPSGDFELTTDRDQNGRLIASVRDPRSRAILATATHDSVTYLVPASDALKRAISASLDPFRAALP